MSNSVQEINQKLKDVIGPNNNYFGRLQIPLKSPAEFKQLGIIPTEDFEQMLFNITEEQQKNLVMIMNYFEIHTRPLKNMLDFDEKEQLYKLYSEIAWSHFATVVMFGMLELATKGKRGLWLNNKGGKIKKFLENNLSDDTKKDIVSRYSTEDIFKRKKITNFSDVIDHLWENIRGEFIHDAGVESKGLDYETLVGIGTKDDPICIKTDVPMQEWLKITWQAILNSYDYKGILQFNR